MSTHNTPAHKKSSASKRNPSLDFVRGSAGLTVAVCHYFMWGGDGSLLVEKISFVAVEVFFILSGFVLAPQILWCMDTVPFKRNFTIFMMRRWMRTVPPYLVALISISLVSTGASLSDFALYAMYIQNLFSLSLDNDYYSVSWSLSIEEWFYVVFPVFLYLLHSRLKLGATAAALAFIIVFAINRLAFADFAEFSDGVRRVVAFRLDSIAFGFLLFLYRDRLVQVGTLVLLVICAVSLAVSFYTAGVLEDVDRRVVWAFFYASPVFASSLILLFLKHNDQVFEKGGIRGFSYFFGSVSYPVYLFHMLTISLMVINGVERYTAASFIGFVVLTVAFAYAFHIYFEKPILKMRPNYARRAHVTLDDSIQTENRQNVL